MLFQQTRSNLYRNEWYNHFLNLLQPDSNHTNKEQFISDLLRYNTLNSVNANMDQDITEKEVIDASRELKNIKASGQNLIKNEMIKTALPILTKQIVKLFNIILSTAQFPQFWTEGIIVPVHKQGSNLDANNYHDIHSN